MSRTHPPMGQRWLSQQDAADYLGVTDRSIRNYIRSGAITGHRMKGSRLIRVDRLELDGALQPLRNGGPGEKGERLGALVALLREHLPRDRYDDEGGSVETYCTCGGWTGDYFADGETGPFDEHLAGVILAALSESDRG